MVESSSLVLHASLAVAGIAAGFINTMAGGGSMLTLPLLMLLGLPADVANGTNRLSVVSQSVAGVWAFHRRGMLEVRALGVIIVPTVLGSALGALAASVVPAEALKYGLIGTMVLMALVMAVHPAAVTAPPGSEARLGGRRGLVFLGLFGAGLYGGFVQAGVGFVLLSVLGGVVRFDLLRANALKLACTTVFGVVALGIFAAAGQIDWPIAGLLALYTVIGSQLGVRFAVGVKPGVIRWVIFCAVVATCVGAFLRG